MQKERYSPSQDVIRVSFCGGLCQYACGFQRSSSRGLAARVSWVFASSSATAMGTLPFEFLLLRYQIGVYNTRCILRLGRHVFVVPTVGVCQDSRRCGWFYFVSGHSFSRMVWSETVSAPYFCFVFSEM